MTVRKIELMQEIFGLSPEEGDTCIKCKNFIHRKGGYSKCKHYGHSHSEATDWKQKQRGCGLFNQDYTGKQVVELVRPDKRVEEPVIEGQISLFEYLEKKNGEGENKHESRIKVTGRRNINCHPSERQGSDQSSC